MNAAAINPEIVVDERFVLQRPINEKPRPGMEAMVGLDQLTERLVFVKARDPRIDHNAVARVKREADISADLHHPQIPAFIDADPDAEHPYIVTELRERHPRIIQEFRSNPNPAFAAELCVAALAPLGYAHEQGVTHRDVKPGNLLMTWLGDVAVGDWEIALSKTSQIERMAAGASPDSENATRFGPVWGSGDYMSPEQVAGLQTIDGRSDLYSVGVILHLLLNGKMPRAGKNANERMVEEIASGGRIIYTPDRPVPPALRQVIGRALQQKPEDRYQSAAEMSEDLERYLRESAISV